MCGFPAVVYILFTNRLPYVRCLYSNITIITIVVTFETYDIVTCRAEADSVV